jgi:Family of unknown function (DUF5643)/Domain of unknown function (DUF4179)
MSDKIHSYKEEIEKIHVPIEKLDAIIAKTVQEASPKRKRVNRKFWYSTGAAVVALGVLVSSTAVSPAMASLVSKIPVIGSILGTYGDSGLKQVSEQGLTTKIGESQVVEGNALTVNEVYYDGTRFTIGYTLETKEPMGEHYLSPATDITVNGETVNIAGSTKHTQITPTLLTGIENIDWVAGMPNEFQLGLTFHAEDDKKWSFSFPVQVSTDTKRVAIDHQQQAGGISLSVSDVKIGPAGLLFSFQAVSNEMDYLSSYLDFKVVDAKGNELASHSGGSQGKLKDGKEYMTGVRRFDPIQADVKELTITPYLRLPSQSGGVAIDENGNETEIQMEPLQGKEIEFKTFTIKLPEE